MAKIQKSAVNIRLSFNSNILCSFKILISDQGKIFKYQSRLCNIFLILDLFKY